MKNLFALWSIVAILLFCNGCNENAEVAKIKINPTLICEDLAMSHPGDIFAIDSIILIAAIRSENEQIYAYNKQNGLLINKFCRKGKAGNELFQAAIAADSDTSFLVHDLNRAGIIYSKRDFSIINRVDTFRSDISFRLMFRNNEYVTVDFDSDKMFKHHSNGEDYLFGEFPLDVKFENKMNLYCGNFLFNSNNSELYFIFQDLPCVQRYKLKDGKFDFIENKFYDTYSYVMDDGMLMMDRINNKFLTSTVTKDYIVALNRRELNNENAEYVPEINLYDFDFNLVKIVEPGVKILNITSVSPNNNTIYFTAIVDGIYNLYEVAL